jgi:uncharacterized membrane protein
MFEYEKIAFGIFMAASYVIVGCFALRILPRLQPTPLASRLMLTACAPLFAAMALIGGTFLAMVLAAFYGLEAAYRRLTGREVLADEIVELPE